MRCAAARRPAPTCGSARAPRRARRPRPRRVRPRSAPARSGGVSRSAHGPIAPAWSLPTLTTSGQDSNARLDEARDLVDVAVHLLDQRLDGVKAALAADAVHELQPQLGAVEVAVEVEQE